MSMVAVSVSAVLRLAVSVKDVIMCLSAGITELWCEELCCCTEVTDVSVWYDFGLVVLASADVSNDFDGLTCGVVVCVPRMTVMCDVVGLCEVVVIGCGVPCAVSDDFLAEAVTSVV